jgi:hypothetical protein
MKILSEPTIVVQIFLAGDLSDIRRACRLFVMQGLCVTVEPTEFIYTGGSETGAAIRLVNYPRFPSDEATLMQKAEALAGELIEAACQWSALVVGPTETKWLTCRSPETPDAKPLDALPAVISNGTVK